MHIDINTEVVFSCKIKAVGILSIYIDFSYIHALR